MLFSISEFLNKYYNSKTIAAKVQQKQPKIRLLLILNKRIVFVCGNQRNYRKYKKIRKPTLSKFNNGFIIRSHAFYHCLVLSFGFSY